MHLREIDANLLVTLDALLVDASVTRAAERLGRSASAISHALAKLREIFADELFVRAGQRLGPAAKAQGLAPPRAGHPRRPAAPAAGPCRQQRRRSWLPPCTSFSPAWRACSVRPSPSIRATPSAISP